MQVALRVRVTLITLYTLTKMIHGTAPISESPTRIDRQRTQPVKSHPSDEMWVGFRVWSEANGLLCVRVCVRKQI